MSPSPAVGRTTRHTPLLMVRIQLAREEVAEIVDGAASAPVVGKWLAKRLGVWKRARRVNVWQGDGSYLSGGNFIVHTTFKVFDLVSGPASPTVLGKFHCMRKSWILGIRTVF